MPEQPRLSESLGRPPANKGKTYPTNRLLPEEVRALLDACGSDSLGKRNRALLMCLYRTGATISEVLDLLVDDVNVDERTLRFVGGRKHQPRDLGIDDPLRDALTEWMDERSKLSLPDPFLFCHIGYWRDIYKGGQRLSADAIRDMLKAVTASAGLTATRVHAQAFRFTLAAELIEEGWPIPYIQKQLGFSQFTSMNKLIDLLRLPYPSDAEVSAVVRTRA